MNRGNLSRRICECGNPINLADPKLTGNERVCDRCHALESITADLAKDGGDKSPCGHPTPSPLCYAHPYPRARVRYQFL